MPRYSTRVACTVLLAALLSCATASPPRYRLALSSVDSCLNGGVSVELLDNAPPRHVCVCYAAYQDGRCATLATPGHGGPTGLSSSSPRVGDTLSVEIKMTLEADQTGCAHGGVSIQFFETESSQRQMCVCPAGYAGDTCEYVRVGPWEGVFITTDAANALLAGAGLVMTWVSWRIRRTDRAEPVTPNIASYMRPASQPLARAT